MFLELPPKLQQENIIVVTITLFTYKKKKPKPNLSLALHHIPFIASGHRLFRAFKGIGPPFVGFGQSAPQTNRVPVNQVDNSIPKRYLNILMGHRLSLIPHIESVTFIEDLFALFFLLSVCESR